MSVAPVPTPTALMCVYIDASGQQVTLRGHYFRTVAGAWTCLFCGWVR